jgi:hypothetical protein
MSPICIREFQQKLFVSVFVCPFIIPTRRTITDAPNVRFEHVDYAAIKQAIEKGVLVNWSTRRFYFEWLSCSAVGSCLRYSIS